MTNVSNVMTLLTGSLVGTDIAAVLAVAAAAAPAERRPERREPLVRGAAQAPVERHRGDAGLLRRGGPPARRGLLPQGEPAPRLGARAAAAGAARAAVRPVRRPSSSTSTTSSRSSRTSTGKYPQGTPLEELDVSVEDRLAPDPAAVPPIPEPRSRGRTCRRGTTPSERCGCRTRSRRCRRLVAGSDRDGPAGRLGGQGAGGAREPRERGQDRHAAAAGRLGLDVLELAAAEHVPAARADGPAEPAGPVQVGAGRLARGRAVRVRVGAREVPARARHAPRRRPARSTSAPPSTRRGRSAT